MSLTTLLKDAVHSDNVSKFSEIIKNTKFSTIDITLDCVMRFVGPILDISVISKLVLPVLPN